MGLKGSKRIRRNFRTCRRNPRDQSGLPRVRESDESHIGEYFQFESQMTLFARLAVLMFARRLMPRTHKMRIAVSPPAATAFRCPPALASFREIKKLFAAVRIKNHRAHRHFQHAMLARSTVAIRPFAMPSALRLKFA